MSFENDYRQLLTYARNRVNARGLSVDPEELISEAYIKFINSGEQYSLPSFKKLLGIEGKNADVRKNNSTISYGVKGSSAIYFRSENTCTKCKKTKPAACFRVVTEKNGNKYQWRRCIECDMEYDKNWRKTESGRVSTNATQRKRYQKNKKRRQHTNNREVNKRGFRKFVENNRTKWNEYLRERDSKGRNELSDSYLRKLLRSKYTTEYILQNPELITECRERIIKKRLGKMKMVA